MSPDDRSTQELLSEIELLKQSNKNLEAQLRSLGKEVSDAGEVAVEQCDLGENPAVSIWECSGCSADTAFLRVWLRKANKKTEEDPSDSWSSRIHPDDVERVRSIIVRAYENKAPFTVEYRLIGSNGNFRYTVDSAIPRFDTSGKLAGYTGSCFDITRQKQIERIILAQRDVSRVFGIVNTAEEALQELIENALKASEMEVLGVYLFDEDSNLILRAHKGLSPDFASRVYKYESEHPLVEMVLEGNPCYSSLDNMYDILRSIADPEGIMEICVIPIKYQNRVIGSLNAGSRRPDKTPMSVKTILEAFAAQCAGMLISFNAQQEVRESHERLRALFDQIQDFIFIGNERGDLIDFNPAVTQKLGYSAEELRQKNIIELHPPDHRVRAQDVVQAMLRGEESNCIIPLMTRSGIRVPVETKVAIGNWGGRKYIFGMSRDLTDRMAAQEALKRSEETYRQMFQVNHAVKLLIDPDTADIIDANQAAADFYGYPIEQLKTMKLFEMSLMSGPQIMEIMKAVSQSKIKYVSAQHIDSNRVVHDVEVFTSPLNLGRKTLLYAIVIDVSERKAAQKKLEQTEKSLREANESLELRVMQRSADLVAINHQLIEEITEHCKTAGSLKESEKNLKIMIDSAPIGIVVIQGGKYVYVNGTFVEIMGLEDAESAIGKHVGSFGGPVHERDSQSFLKNCLEKSELLNLKELRLKVRDSKELTLNVWFQPLELWGKPSIIGFYIDVSEERQLRSHLNQSQKMQALGSLAGGIAHDFNNILFAITGFAELASDSLKENPQAQKHIHQLLQAAERAADLIRHILTFSREAETEKRPLWINPILKESLNFLRASIPASIEIKRNIYPDSGLVNADPTQIHQVIMNLVTNAAHSMRDKGGVLEVDLEQVELTADFLQTRPDNKPGVYQRLRISDTGTGIPPAIMDRIFDPYFTTKEIGQGTGLGLSVVDGIVRSHNGLMMVQSSIGVGSVFEVFLPVIKDCEEGGSPIMESDPLIKGRILFVDDEEIVTLATKANLENMGYEVSVANDPLVALVTFQNDPHAFDLVITDMGMPRMNGAELSRAIWKIRSNMPVIMLSGFAELMNKETALAIGMRDFLLKPLRRGVLADAVSKVLREAS